MNTNCALSRTDTGVLKGIAILGMLFHHIYACPPAGVEHYGGVLGFLGVIGKVCVSIFLFCSAYGLSLQYEGTESVVDSIKFVLKRLVKFYLNYWVIFLLFVPIGVWVFSRPLSAAYGENVNLWKNLFLDLLGIQGLHSYNITWWFNALIIKFYLFFPIAYHIARKCPVVFVLFSVFATWRIEAYWLAFASGVLWHLYEAPISRCLERLPKAVAVVGVVLLCAAAVWGRDKMPGYFGGIRWDAVITWTIVLLTIVLLRACRPLMQGLAFLGKHSGNIYMTHTFIYAYWFPKWVYICDMRIGGGGILAVCATCLVLSLLIEYMKARAGVYKLGKRINEYIDKY